MDQFNQRSQPNAPVRRSIDGVRVSRPQPVAPPPAPPQRPVAPRRNLFGRGKRPAVAPVATVAPPVVNRPAAPRPVAQRPQPPVRTQPARPMVAAPVAAQVPAAQPARVARPKRRSGGAVRVILQTVLALLVIVTVAAAVVFLYVKYYQ